MSINRNFFFNQIKQTLFSGKLSQTQLTGLTSILNEWERNYLKNDDRFLAYMLATAHHETDRQINGIEEYGKGKGRPYGKKIKMSRNAYLTPDKLYYGRGLVQLTWYENYEKAGRELGIDFLNNPALALEINNATKIMFLGMTEGWFTGKKLLSYFNGPTEDWVNARRIINSLDKANLIATYAHQYYAAISNI